MRQLSASSALRRYLVLTALRWLPTGLMIPIFVLLPLHRGLGLSEIGVAMAMQGLVVAALELPTGGLADTIGRRRMLLGATTIAIGSLVLFLLADTFAELAIAFALTGVYRALDSGPLDAWYVDTAMAAEPGLRVERGMSAHGTVLGVAIATGALASGALVAWDPLSTVDALVVPGLLAVALDVVGLVAIAWLMTERPASPGWRGIARSALATPRTIGDGLRLLRLSPVLLAIVSVELFWGFGMATFESLFPVRLAELTGGADQAAAITGPAASVAWLASAAGAAVTPWLARRLGVAPVAALMRVLQGLTVAAMGFFAGIAGILVAYLLCNAVHGTSNAVHMTLLHRQVTSGVRATVVSLNSMVSQPAGALGLVVLTALADASSVSTAMYVGAVVLALAAPLYVPAWRQARRGRPVTPAADKVSPVSPAAWAASDPGLDQPARHV
ncbi:MAG TPA: MFS transporter [Micromonosporaceae bacterium]|nr:MFS transporter [Micromonosporaceae bacterium]